MVSTAAAGSLQIDAPSISPSTSSITQQVSSANAGDPPPSEASSLTFSIINSTKQVVHVESLDVSIQDG